MANKLVIIDGNSLFYRSFYALPLLSNANGEYSNAVYGFAVQIVRIINEIKPTHIAVAFDAGKHTFRNDMYDGYKANRKPMPPELKSQIEPLKKMLKIMNIDYVEKLGYEGDDVVGTLAKKFADTETIIVTADRDTLQLIDDTTKVYFTKKGTTELYDVDEGVLARDYGVKPLQIIDLKALQGDSSDNIPGVAGIGEKTAVKLLQEYGSVEGVYQNIDKISGKTKEYLSNGRENAFLSKKLATIDTHVPIDTNLNDCKYIFPFGDDVKEFFRYYDFKSLIRREEIFVHNQEEHKHEQKQQTVEDVNSAEKLQNLQQKLAKLGEFAFFEDKIKLYFSDKQTEYTVDYLNFNPLELANFLQEVFAQNNKKVVFDKKQTRHFLDMYGAKLEGDVFDLSIAKHLVDGASIKSAESILLDEQDKQTPATIIFNLKGELFGKLEALGMMSLYQDVELPMADVLYQMEVDGFAIDKNVLEELSVRFEKELVDLEHQIYDLVGVEFNVNSPKQLAEILYDKLGLKHGKKQSTSADKLEAIADMHPVVPLILRYRKIAKLNNTYIDGFRPHIDKNGLVHTTFKQTLTNTGRLSSTEPNLQNIPIRSEDGKIVRSMFVARSKDNVLIDADYSQIELRLLAHLSGDEYFIDAFKNGEDIHTKTASLVFKVSMDAVDKNMRRVAKVVNFGIIYGISEFGLANDLGIKSYEAKRLIDDFYNGHPKVKEYVESQVRLAKETGRVKTVLGRTRSMPEINSSNYMVRSMAERASQNMPLQGSAADIVKIAMVKVAKALKDNNMKTKLILQVHDELILDAPKEEEEQAKQLVKDCMEHAYALKVPLDVDISTCYRWSDGH